MTSTWSSCFCTSFFTTATLVCAVEAGGGHRGSLLQPRGKAFRLIVNERVVEQVESLQRGGARSARRGAGAGVGSVEDREVRVTLDALRHQIDAAVVRIVDRLERFVLGEVPVLLRRKRMRAAWSGFELAAQHEQCVAQ